MAEAAQPLAPDYELKTVKVGSYTVLRPAGVNTPDLLEEITDQFLEQAWLLAVELRQLRKVNLPLVRALWEYGQRTGSEGGRMIFINPTDRVRAMLRLLAGEELVQFVRWEKQLEGTPEEVDTRVREYIHEIYEMVQRLAADPTCQYLDDERNWVCPYCATLRDNIRIVSFETVNDACSPTSPRTRGLRFDFTNRRHSSRPFFASSAPRFLSVAP